MSEQVAADLNTSGFDSIPDRNVMARKYLKLLSNLGNALQAACGTRSDDPAAAELWRLAQEEGSGACRRPGSRSRIPISTPQRRAALGAPRPVGGHDLSRGSSWQSLARGTGNIEADWLNGEIVLLGRLHGVATPVNELLRSTANRMATERIAPGSIAAEDLLNQL